MTSVWTLRDANGVVKSLADCLEVLGDRRAAVARELTKMHEEIVRGTLGELGEHYSTSPVKGEIVLVIERAGKEAVSVNAADPKTLAARIADLIAEGRDPKTALKKAAKEFGMSKSEAYRRTKVKSEK